MKYSNPFHLNKKDKRIYLFANFIIFFSFLILALFVLIKVIFPSQFFTYSFANINSLKNTLSDISQKKNELLFFASTPLSFSTIKVDLELADTNSDLEGQKINAQKSYKAFFYPEGTSLTSLENKEENSLVSIDDSVFIIGNQKKTPIDSTTTFEGLGYNWDNLRVNTTDLGIYEKQKLADINATHPTGTFLKTNESATYYFIENFTKRKVSNFSEENIKNPISVDEKSLTKTDFCILKKHAILNKKYSCKIPLSQISSFAGKDYRFMISNLSDETKIKKIDVEFKKSLTQENFRFFLGDLKKKILYRFGFKDA